MTALDTGNDRELDAAVSQALRNIRISPLHLAPLVEEAIFGKAYVSAATSELVLTLTGKILASEQGARGPMEAPPWARHDGRKSRFPVQKEMFEGLGAELGSDAEAEPDLLDAIAALMEIEEGPVEAGPPGDTQAETELPAIVTAPAPHDPQMTRLPLLSADEAIGRSLFHDLKERRRRIVLPGSRVTIRRFDEHGWFGIEEVLLAHPRKRLAGALPIESSLGAALLYSWPGCVIEYDTGLALEGAQIMRTVAYSRWRRMG